MQLSPQTAEARIDSQLINAEAPWQGQYVAQVAW
jgi:hypothetical protein